MKYIQKQTVPQELEDYKREAGASFKGLTHKPDVKRKLKLSLIEEQGGLCCYCGSRIKYESAMIEHLKPKDPDKFPELQLEYSNLLSSCMGGQIERRDDIKFEHKKYPLSCDAKKNNTEIKISPLDSSCESFFRYDTDGNIYGTSQDARDTIKILGLDNKVLVNKRKAAIEAYRTLSLATKEEWQNEIGFLTQRNQEGLFEPYCFAVIYCINNYFMVLVAD